MQSNHQSEAQPTGAAQRRWSTLRRPICGLMSSMYACLSPRNCTRCVVKAWECIARGGLGAVEQGSGKERAGLSHALKFQAYHQGPLQARPAQEERGDRLAPGKRTGSA